MSKNCQNCAIAAGEITPVGGLIYSDAEVILFHNLDTAIPGYLILMPRRHLEFYHELKDGELGKLALITKIATQVLASLAGVERVYINSFGEEVRHLHFHLFPRYNWMLDRQGMVINGKVDAVKVFQLLRAEYKVGPDKMLGSAILQVVVKIKSAIDAALLG